MEDKLQTDLKQAQLDRNEVTLLTLRSLLSELKYAKLNKGLKPEDSFDDESVITVIQKEAKKRKESIEAYEKGGREDLKEKEQKELEVLEKYLPAQISDEELTNMVVESILEIGATEISDMGKVIANIKAKVGQSADPSRISNIARERLGK
jgi:uncharacterized protein YqeY